MLWDDPLEQPRKCAQVIAKVANPSGMRVSQLLMECEQVVEAADVRNLPQAATATAKLGEIDRQLAALRPAEHVGFLGRVQAFLGKVSGRLARFPVPAGTPQGDRSVKEAVASGLQALIEEHRQAIAGFGEDTREGTLARAAERVRLVRHKLSAYSEYLAGERDRLERDLAEAARELRAKVERLAPPSEATAAPA